jgi:SAM-dependent methyltransferase
MTATLSMSPEMQALKTRLKTIWMAGDYGHFGIYMEQGALEFLERLALAPGTRLLDVACGAGRLAIPAARAGVRVTGVDIATNSVQQARERAREEGLDARFDEGDAEALPYEDASFEVVVSFIGAMFAPRPELVATELLRVCEPGGRIVMGNWTPEGAIGQMFKAIGRHVPPSPLMASPVQWGVESVVRERLQAGAASIRVTRRTFPFRYPFAPSGVVDFFREWYGPTNRAFATLDEAGQAALHFDLEQVWRTNNTATDGTTSVDAEYIEVEVRRK